MRLLLSGALSLAAAVRARTMVATAAGARFANRAVIVSRRALVHDVNTATRANAPASANVEDLRVGRQLELIREVTSLAAANGTDCWLRGGWALDFLLGRITRPHGDIDLFIWAADADALLDMLSQHGYAQVAGPPPDEQLNLRKAGEDFHVALLERTEVGVVTAGGRWADSPWPDGMLDGPERCIGDVCCRVIGAEAQLWAKVEVPRALGHAQREYDLADIALLREAVTRTG